MKFISGIKKDKLRPELEIRVPIYHRTSISFFNGTEVYYLFRTYSAGKFEIGELVLTPIKPEIWHHIRKITVDASDSPGIIYTIASKLRDLKINVNIEEAITTQIGAGFNISLIVDLSMFILHHPKGYNFGDRIPEEAIKEIENELRQLKHASSGTLPFQNANISIRELSFLESHSNTTARSLVTGFPDSQFQNSSNQKIRINNAQIRLEPRITSALKLKEAFHYTMFSDTEEKYIKLLFFDPNQSVAFIDIFHEDVYGAIATFTEILVDGFGFNILASYSHQQMQKETAHWYGLIDISANKEKFFSDVLARLKNAKYGEKSDEKQVKEVFLIETNCSDVSDDTILQFGQNRKTKDGERTSVYLRKVDLLKDRLSNYGYSNYKKTPKAFFHENNLAKTTSVAKLVNGLVRERESTRETKLRKILLLTAKLLVAAILIWLITLAFPAANELVAKLREHAIAVFLILMTILIVFASEDLLKKLHARIRRNE